VVGNRECPVKFIGLPGNLSGQVGLLDLHLCLDAATARAYGADHGGAVGRGELNSARLGRLISEGDLDFLVTADGQPGQHDQANGTELADRTHFLCSL
jgi:hypothetical protein